MVSRPDTWFPDWSSRPCAIIAAGPSAEKVNYSLLKGRFTVLAIKEGIRLYPDADAVYGCDAAWWKHRKGLADFKGLKIAWAVQACDRYRDLHRIEIDQSQDKVYPVETRRYAMHFGSPGKVGNGGNSGFQAVNLAAQFGARKILLIGFDMHDRSGVHWYGRNRWDKGGNPDESNFKRWRKAFDAAAPVLAAMGVDVVNASPISDLTCFRRLSVERAIAEWAL